MQGIGYKEILEHLNGITTLEEASEKIKINTRHYAKRQLTWFKNQVEATWYNLSKQTKQDVVNDVLSKIK